MALLANLIPAFGVERDMVSRSARWLGTVIGTAASTWLIGRDFDSVQAHKIGVDLTNLVVDVAPLLLPAITLWLGSKDGKRMVQQLVSVRALTADVVATAARHGNGLAAEATAEAIKSGEIVIEGEASKVAQERAVAVTAAIQKANVVLANGSGGGSGSG